MPAMSGSKGTVEIGNLSCEVTGWDAMLIPDDVEVVIRQPYKGKTAQVILPAADFAEWSVGQLVGECQRLLKTQEVEELVSCQPTT